MRALHLNSEIHPLSIRRPSRRCALPLRTYLTAGRAAIEWNQAARLPGWIHFDNQSPLAIGRGVRIVRHRAFVLRKINLAVLRAVFRSRDNSHVSAGSYFGEQDPALVEPGESR